MKRVRCPKCDQYVTFDETRYEDGQSLVFQCIHCGRQFGIRMGVSKLKKIQREDKEPEIDDSDCSCGAIVVIENVFHFKQVIPLRMGENIIGRYQRDSRVNCPIETVDPSVDITHCVITVSRANDGSLRYILRDGPSNTGTFVDNQILGDRERRVIAPGTLFTIGATSILLRGKDDSQD